MNLLNHLLEIIKTKFYCRLFFMQAHNIGAREIIKHKAFYFVNTKGK